MVFPMGCDSGGSSQEQEDEPKYVGLWKNTEEFTGGGFNGTVGHYFNFFEDQLVYRRTNEEDQCLFGSVSIEIEDYDEETNIMTLSIPDSNPFPQAERLQSELTIEMPNDSSLTIDGRSWTESDGSSLPESQCG